MKRIQSLLAAGSLIALFAACTPASEDGFDVMSALQSDADVVVYLDAKSGNASPIMRAMEANFPEASQNQFLEIPVLAEFVQANDLTQESLETFALSVAGVGAAITDEDPSHLRFSGAVRVNRPLNADSVKTAIEQASAESEEPVEVTLTSHPRGDILTLPGQNGMPDLSILLANEDGGCNLIFATAEQLDAAIAGRSGALPRSILAAQAMAQQGSYFWAAMVLPEESRAMLAELPANPMLGPADAALKTFSAMALSGVATETLNLRLNAAFATESDAQAVQTFIQSAVMPMMMMFASQVEGGMPPALQSIKFETAGNEMLMGISLTEADLAKLAELQ